MTGHFRGRVLRDCGRSGRTAFDGERRGVRMRVGLRDKARKAAYGGCDDRIAWWAPVHEHVHVHLASPDDGADVASILADGFRSDPVISWVLDDREQMHTFFASLVADPVRRRQHLPQPRQLRGGPVRTAAPGAEGDLATRFTTTMRTS